jgi:hypothetical protein
LLILMQKKFLRAMSLVCFWNMNSSSVSSGLLQHLALMGLRVLL